MSSSVFSFSLTFVFQRSRSSRAPTSAKQPRRVDVADDLQRVLGAVGQLVHVDEERVHLPGRARVVPPENASYQCASFCILA